MRLRIDLEIFLRRDMVEHLRGTKWHVVFDGRTWLIFVYPVQGFPD